MIALALLVLAPPSATDLAAHAEGLWTSAAQSQSEAYDFVASETRRHDAIDGGVWLDQQNWILGERAAGDAQELVRTRHDREPYFQVVIRLRDFGDGVVHTTTYRLRPEALKAARDFVSYRSRTFDLAWLGEAVCMGEQRAVGDGFWHGSASCPNGYKGGVKVESVSVRSPGAYVNWDRGFDAEGNHIWGPASGGYVFKRWEEQ